MATRRLGTLPYSVKSMQLNRELRALLVYLTANPNKSLQTLSNQMQWSHAKTRNSMENLVQVDLAYVSEKKETIFKSNTHYFSAAEYSEYDLDALLPIVRPEGGSVQVSALSDKGVPVKRNNAVWRSDGVRRDPLTRALMGTGVAPSILFQRRENASS